MAKIMKAVIAMPIPTISHAPGTGFVSLFCHQRQPTVSDPFFFQADLAQPAKADLGDQGSEWDRAPLACAKSFAKRLQGMVDKGTRCLLPLEGQWPTSSSSHEVASYFAQLGSLKLCIIHNDSHLGSYASWKQVSLDLDPNSCGLRLHSAL